MKKIETKNLMDAEILSCLPVNLGLQECEELHINSGEIFLEICIAEERE